MDELKKIKGVAKGRNGDINYEIDVKNNKLEDFKVLEHSETKGIFNQVIDRLKQDIIQKQSFNVDVVSGATVMTKALLDSANQTISKENIELKAVNDVKENQTDQVINTDVLIIGGGETGLIAGCKALSMGKKVLLVEKNGYLGGATILNGSNIVGTGSDIAQKIFGKNNDSAKKLEEDVARESKNTNDVELTKLMAKNIGDAIDFISDFANLNYQKAQTQTPEHSINRQIELPSASSYEFIQKVSQSFIAAGGEILLDTRVEGISTDSSQRIDKVICQQRTRQVIIIPKKVVLASGGFGANQKMRGKESEGIDYYGPQTSTGDAYVFNKDLGLKTSNLGWYKIYPHGVETEPGIAKLTTYASKKATDIGAIYVNSEGHRIVDESDVYTTLRDAVLKQKDKVAFLVMDQSKWNEVYELLVLHDFTPEEISGYFNAPNQLPIFAKGSLEEVAQAAKINSTELAETVEKYNDAVDVGEDSEFNRDVKFMRKLEGNQYYVFEQRDRFATTLGGYSIAPENLKLLTINGQTVDNYFGAGEVVGGANGHDSMPSMMNTWAVSSGYAAGKQAASEL